MNAGDEHAHDYGKEDGDDEKPEAIQAAKNPAVAQLGEDGLLPFKNLPKITSAPVIST